MPTSLDSVVEEAMSAEVAEHRRYEISQVALHMRGRGEGRGREGFPFDSGSSENTGCERNCDVR